MKAIVLCAGYGTRLGSLTYQTPKSMLLLQGKPLLAYTLCYLADQGFAKVAINLHFMPEQITNYVGDGSQFGVRVHYSYEAQALGTAGALKQLGPWLKDASDVLVLYGDILTDQNLSELVTLHRTKGALATLLLHQRLGSNSRVQIGPSNRIVGFIERPTNEQPASQPGNWVNSGVSVLNRSILDYIPADVPFDLPRDVFSKWAGKEPMYGVPLTGYRCAIDSPARYAEADAAVAHGVYKLPSRLSSVASSPVAHAVNNSGDKR